MSGRSGGRRSTCTRWPTEDGLRLDEHLNPLLERPPLAEVLSGPEAAWAGRPGAALTPQAVLAMKDGNGV